MNAAAMEANSAPFRVLALEGGGTLAVGYLPIIEAIENHICGNSKSSLRDSGQFQMFAGTSTGAIVATALKIGMPVKKIKEFYLDRASNIFKKAPYWDRFLFFQYYSERLTDELVAALGKQGRQKWRSLSANEHGDVELIVTLWDHRRSRAVFLSSNTARNHPRHATELHDATIADVITACCSAPYYFSPAGFFEASGNYVGTYCDGGLTGLNNPAAFTISLASLDRTKHVISLGTGEKKSDLSEGVFRDSWVKPEVERTVDSLMSSSSSLMDDFHIRFGSSLGVDKFLRTNHTIDEGSDLAETRPQVLDQLLKSFESERSRFLSYQVEPTAENGVWRTLTPEKFQTLLDKFGFKAVDSTEEPSENSVESQIGQEGPVLTMKPLRKPFWQRFFWGNVPILLAIATLILLFAGYKIYTQNVELAHLNAELEDPRDLHEKPFWISLHKKLKNGDVRSSEVETLEGYNDLSRQDLNRALLQNWVAKEGDVYKKGAGFPRRSGVPDNREWVEEIDESPYPLVCHTRVTVKQTTNNREREFFGTAIMVHPNLVLTQAYNVYNARIKDGKPYREWEGFAKEIEVFSGLSKDVWAPIGQSGQYIERVDISDKRLFCVFDEWKDSNGEDSEFKIAGILLPREAPPDLLNRVGRHKKLLVRLESPNQSPTKCRISTYTRTPPAVQRFPEIWDAPANVKINGKNSLLNYDGTMTGDAAAGAPIWYCKDGEPTVIGIHTNTDKGIPFTPNNMPVIAEWIEMAERLRAAVEEKKKNFSIDEFFHDMEQAR